MTFHDPELRYVRHTPAGAEYVHKISADDSDRRVRAAFRELVISIAPPGAKLYDFGAGPGLDARFFALRGFQVTAYDVDPRMREFFSVHCRELMASGTVSLDGRSYREFLADSGNDNHRPADLVISNFAPLNLVDDLQMLFKRLDALTGPNGRVLASVLNPWFIDNLKSPYWWRDFPRLALNGEVFQRGPQAPYYRRLPHRFRAACAPHFHLRRVFRGFPSEPWRQVSKYRYLFLLFEKPVNR